MARPYSKRFLYSGGGVAAIYVVPAGFVAIVKSVTGFNGAATAGQVALQINGSTIFASNPPAGTPVTAAGLMIVYNAGEEMKLFGTASLNSQVSGYLLETSG